MNKWSNYSMLCQLNKYSTLLFMFTFIIPREYTEIMDEFLWIVRACVCGNYEKRTELRVVKIRRTVTKRQKFLLTGSKNNYPAERRHISCNYRTTRVRRVNIIARMRPDGIYTEDTHTYTHTYTRTQCDNSTNSYTDSAISTPWIADIEFPPTKPRCSYRSGGNLRNALPINFKRSLFQASMHIDRNN